MDNLATTLLKLMPVALLPVLLSGVLCYLKKKGVFARWKQRDLQILIGVLFGGLAILGTEFGIDIGGAVINARDAAPLCAGLLFGAPAGLIAGVIGGVERYFAVYWGAGAYTQIACSVSTVISGLLASSLRRHMFDNKTPGWYYGLGIGAAMEVFHMLMIFVTHGTDTHFAFSFVKACALPMILANSIALCLSILCVNLVENRTLKAKREKRTILGIFQGRLLIVVTVAFALSLAFIYVMQTQLSKTDARRVMLLNIEDIQNEINEKSNQNILKFARAVAGVIDDGSFEKTNEDARLIAEQLEVKEINIVDENGIIIASSDPVNPGFDMSSGEQSSAFLMINKGLADELVQNFQPISRDSDIYRKYAAVALKDGGFVQIGYDSEDISEELNGIIAGSTRYRRIGESGYLLIADENGKIVSGPDGTEGMTIPAISSSGLAQENRERELIKTSVEGADYFCAYGREEGYLILALTPVSEAMFTRNLIGYVTMFMEILVFAILFGRIFFLIKQSISDNMKKINRSLQKITEGDLTVRMNVRDNYEFSTLSDSINITVDTIKDFMDKEREHFEKELELAKTIQSSALPKTFPAFPNRLEIDIWASMDAAKEVGGDFYDFYFVRPNVLAFLIADVSGKGIPAALFMMRAKATIKNRMELGDMPNEALTSANASLCEGNEAGMFVTAWLGCLDLENGHIVYANAGHNPPVIRNAEGEYGFLKEKPGFVLAGMEGCTYKLHEMDIKPDDFIFLYTDGVTEATNAEEQLYGEERLLNVIRHAVSEDPKLVCKSVREDIDVFVGTAPQFDDITLLCLKYMHPAADK